MPGEGAFQVELSAVSDDMIDRLAGDLSQELTAEMARAKSDVAVERSKADRGSQDFGAILGIVLGSGAVVELARALHSWLARHNQVSMTVRTASGDLVATGLESHDVAAIVAALDRARGR